MNEGEEQTPLGKITISTKMVKIGDCDYAQVRISDTGSGISPEVLPRIFDPFFTTKDVGMGTGQGLAISHDIVVKKHKGTIECESELGRGTTFIICIPTAEYGAR
jgi:signal transduction histidine kinase